LPPLPGFRDDDTVSDHIEVDVEDWLGWRNGKALVAQRLRQEDERQTILLAFEVE